MTASRIDEKMWVRCGKCGHKLMKIVSVGHCPTTPEIEIKCHSCKELNVFGIVMDREVESHDE